MIRRTPALSLLTMLALIPVAFSATSRAAEPEPSTSPVRAGDEYTGVALDASAPLADAAPLPVAITVAENQVVRPFSPNLFGFNHNWFQSEAMLYPDREATEIDPAYPGVLGGLPLPLNRMSGTAAQYYRWKQMLGPVESRTTQQLRNNRRQQARRLGPLEWFDSVLRTDPAARFSWTLNLAQDATADHRDLARLVSADADDEWGRHRVTFGLADPVPIDIWELGNELDWGEHAADFPVERYIAESRAAIAAIREVLPDARFAAHARTAPWGPNQQNLPGGWEAWHREVLRELGDDLDYIAFHPYYHGHPVPVIERYLDQIVHDIRDVTGSDRIKLYLSEHAFWPNRPPADSGREWRDTWHHTHGLRGCLGTSEFLNRILYRPDVTTAGYHSFSGGPWGVVFRGPETGRLYASGIRDLFALYHEAAGGDIVTITTDGGRADIRENDLSFTASAFVVGDELRLVLTNREPDAPRAATFDFTQNYDLVETVTLTGDMLESHHTEHGPGLSLVRQIQPTPDGSEAAPFAAYEVPAKSIVLLKLRARR